MNKLTIIGNLTRDPELRTTTNGVNVCSFTVAVNRKKTANNKEPETDFFRVSAWRGLADVCSKYLSKGRKVCVCGPVSVKTYQANDGSTRAELNVTADDVEFVGGRDGSTAQHVDQESGYVQVSLDDNPFDGNPFA